MKTLKVVFIAACIAAVVSLFDMFFIVSEYEQAVVTQAGHPIAAVRDAGLHIKIPFIQRVVRYERRIFRWSGEPREITTWDNQVVAVHAEAVWKIDDPMRFLQAAGTYDQAFAKMDEIVDPLVMGHLSAYPLTEIVRTTDRTEAEKRDAAGGPPESNQPKAKTVSGREKIFALIAADASKAMSEYGIRLLDVRLRRLDYGGQIRAKVFERMIAERRSMATRLKSEGEGRASEIMGLMEKELQAVRSEADKTAEEIRGSADAEAARIYNKSYSQDPAFYSFYKTLQTYRETSFENTTLILGTDTDYYKILKGTSK